LTVYIRIYFFATRHTFEHHLVFSDLKRINVSTKSQRKFAFLAVSANPRNKMGDFRGIMIGKVLKLFAPFLLKLNQICEIPLDLLISLNFLFPLLLMQVLPRHLLFLIEADDFVFLVQAALVGSWVHSDMRYLEMGRGEASLVVLLGQYSQHKLYIDKILIILLAVHSYNYHN